MADVLFASSFTGDADFESGFVDVLDNIRQDLVSYIPCDEDDGTTRRDVYGTNDTAETGGTVEQDVQIASGGSPNSAHFDAAGEFLTKASPSGLPGGTGSFTAAFWARIDGTLGTNQGAVALYGVAGGDQRQFSIMNESTTQAYRFAVSSNGIDDIGVNDDDPITSTGEVHFVVGWYDGDSDTVNIQVDNTTPVSAAGPSSVHSSTSSLDIGRVDHGIDRIFDGLIQDVALWARVLTAEERTALYAGGAGVWLERFIPRDLSTFTEMWKFNETASVNAVGVNGTDLTEIGVVPNSAVGHVEDPASNLLARGPTSPHGFGQDYFTKSFAASDIFDIRGKVSCFVAFWYKLTTGLTGTPFGFSIHGETLNPGGANGQAIVVQMNEKTVGASDGPFVFLEDGVTPFSGPGVKASSAAVTEILNTWAFAAGGYDADRNVGFAFWGRTTGEYYYTEVAAGSVFRASGFGYNGTGTKTSFGEYMFPTGGSTIPVQFDQALWFKGTALPKTFIPRLPSIIRLWNNHVGVAETNLNFAGVDFAISFEADADFEMVLNVPGLIAFSLFADADFTMDFREVPFVAQPQADADFTVALQVRDLDLAFSFDAAADFTAPLLGQLDGIGTAVDHYWKGEEASGTRFDELNAAGGSINLSDVNTVGQAAGRIGNAPDFVRGNSEELDGTASDLNFDGSASFGVLVWVAIDDNVSAPGNVQASIVTKWQNPSDRGWGLVYDQSADAFQAVTSTTGSDAFVASSATFISTALALVYMDYDSGTGVIRCSVNNGTKGTNTPGTTINQSTQILRVGSIRLGGAFSDYFGGVIDELIIFNRKLTDAELSAFYAGGAGRDLRDFVVTDFVF